MPLQTRIRSDYEPAIGLRPVSGGYLQRELGRNSPAGRGLNAGRNGESRPGPGPEEIEIARDLPVTSLPILATANDARELVRFFKKRPNGVTVIEAMNAEPRRIFDARKIAAYEFWGLLRRENDRLNLTGLGRELADVLEPECAMYRDILNAEPAYRTALESIFEEGLDIATHPDVLRYWSDSGMRPDGDPQELEAAVVCFFSLCHAAELGTSTVGKRGQPARLRLDVDELRSFVTSTTGSAVSPRMTEIPFAAAEPQRTPSARSAPSTRVLISASGGPGSADQLVSLLSLAGFESSVVSFSDNEAGLIPTGELAEMQRCHAAVFVIGPDDRVEREDGTLALRPGWTTKISVAAAIFDWRVVLFWNGRLPPPEELTGSGLVVLSSEELDWSASLDIAGRIKALTD